VNRLREYVVVRRAIGPHVPRKEYEVTSTSSRRGTAGPRLALLRLVVLLGALVGASQAGAAVSVSRAELNNARLRVEGTAAPNRTITVDGVSMGRSDGNGSFRKEVGASRDTRGCIVQSGD